MPTLEVGDVVEVDSSTWSVGNNPSVWTGFVAVVVKTWGDYIDCRPFPYGETPVGLGYFSVGVSSLRLVCKGSQCPR